MLVQLAPILTTALAPHGAGSGGGGSCAPLGGGAGERARAAAPERLMQAISNGDLTSAAALLAADPSVARAADAAGRTPLHAAAAFAGLDGDAAAAVGLLVAAGADPNAADAAGVTPLMEAVREVGYGGGAAATDPGAPAAPPPALAAAAALLAAGADPRACDAAGRVPLHHVGAGHADGCYYMAATDDLASDIIQMTQLVKLLLAAGADAGAADRRGRRAPQAAAGDGNACAVLAMAAAGLAPPAVTPAATPKLARRLALAQSALQAWERRAAAVAAARQQGRRAAGALDAPALAPCAAAVSLKAGAAGLVMRG